MNYMLMKKRNRRRYANPIKTPRRGAIPWQTRALNFCPTLVSGSFRTYVEHRPDDSEGFCNLARAVVETGNYKESLSIVLGATKLDPQNANLRYNLGTAYSNLAMHDEAVATFKEAIRMNPNDAGSHSRLAVSYAQMEKLVDAIDAAKEGVRLAPRSADAYLCLRIELLSPESYPDSADAFRKSLELDPNQFEAQANLGYVCLRLDRTDEAIKALNESARDQTERRNGAFPSC